MNVIFDLRTEQNLLTEYLGHLFQPVSERQGERIRRTCDDFRRMQLGESVLVKAHTTEWILLWRESFGAQVKPVVRISRMEALGRWWAWLFQQSFLDDNVLACFYPCSHVLREKNPLVLRRNLQRPIASYLEERGPRQPETRRKVLRLLLNFNVFLHREGTDNSDSALIDEKRIISWLRQLSETKCLHSLALAAGTTNGFLRFLVDSGHIDANPLTGLRKRYKTRRWEDFLAGLLEFRNAGLEPAVVNPRFVSSLAPHLQAFVDLKRAMGRRYESSEANLQRFDRFVADFSGQSTAVTKEIVDAWVKSMGRLKLGTRKKLLGLVRQFCLYLSRHDPNAYVPKADLVKGRSPEFTPHIYTVEEFRGLLKAAQSMPARPGSLRPKTVYTTLLILYGTGLRIGEALRLRLRDVDVEKCALVIRDTKFFKSRIVPISVSLSEAIAGYLNERLKATSSPEAFLFLNHRGGRYSTDKYAEIFHALLVTAKVKWASNQHRPRVYDIRHTFAHRCVLRWYREGADLQAKLPLLATYMGHVSVLSTQQYLKATPESLRAAGTQFERSYGAVVDFESNGGNR